MSKLRAGVVQYAPGRANMPPELGNRQASGVTAYQNYAPYYDATGQIRFAVLMAHYVRDVLVRHPAPGRRMLDLACGTGTLALLFADEGWAAVGLDASPATLAQARAKAANLDTVGSVAFVQGDMRQPGAALAGISNARPGSFDLATCVYDSLNYLLDERELAACFAGIAEALAPGGVALLDMNTHHFLEHDWLPSEVLELPGFVQVSQSHFDPATACSTMVLTGFSGDDAQGYQRFDETHVERAYPPELVAELLAAAGLLVEATYDCFTFQPLSERAQRIAWVVRKPAN